MRAVIKAMKCKNVAEFADKTGLRKSTVYAIIKNNSKPQLENLELLENAGINTDWLLTGKGEMLLRDQERAHRYESTTGVRTAVRDTETGVQRRMKDYIRKRHEGEPVDTGETLKLIYQIIRLLSDEYLQALKAFIESEIEHRKD